MSFPDTLEIKETISTADPGMVTVTIDVDARLATVVERDGRMVLTMRLPLPRDAWPGGVLGTYCASCGGTGKIDAPMQYDVDGSPCDGRRECGACQGRGR